ncbi:MAG: LytR/AlgR family response regulator transcription factor [Aureispira sp.]
MHALIVDDEELARVTLRALIKEFCPAVTRLTEASNVLQAVELIKSKAPQLVFLDIEMPNISGLQLPSFFQEGELDFQIIFTTAYSQYAVEAFRLSAVDYLLKPISIDQLQVAVEKAKKQAQFNTKPITALQENLQHQSIRRLVVPTSDSLEFIAVEQIRWFMAQGAYTEIHLYNNQKILVSKNLKTFQKLEDYSHFFKPHRSYLINVHSIQRFSQTDNVIVLDNKETVPLSKRKKKAFLALIKTLDLGYQGGI